MGYESREAISTENEVHYWRPPCSCGVELNEALEVERSVSSKEVEKGDVHFWRPPCSCGVSLEDAVD